ncbi:MmgE/PrpD family protein, partial [Micromonospora azadirachtae]
MADEDTVAGRLASWASRLRFEDLPTEVVERTEQVILDQLGVQVLGSTLPNIQPVRQLAAAAPGAPESTVTGSDEKTTAAQAAYMNGTLGHSCEYDDAHAAAWHTSSAVVPAAL